LSTQPTCTQFVGFFYFDLQKRRSQYRSINQSLALSCCHCSVAASSNNNVIDTKSIISAKINGDVDRSPHSFDQRTVISIVSRFIGTKRNMQLLSIITAVTIASLLVHSDNRSKFFCDGFSMFTKGTNNNVDTRKISQITSHSNTIGIFESSDSVNDNNNNNERSDAHLTRRNFFGNTAALTISVASIASSCIYVPPVFASGGATAGRYTYVVRLAIVYNDACHHWTELILCFPLGFLIL
jgi:hypothetical protein